MHNVLMVILAVVSAILILAVLAQPSNSDAMTGAFDGGVDGLYGKKKVKPYEALLRKITIVMAVVFFVLAIILLVIG